MKNQTKFFDPILKTFVVRLAFLAVLLLPLLSSGPAFATPPYQVVCYALNSNEASATNINDASGPAINWTSNVPWSDMTVVADAFFQPNTGDTFTNQGAKTTTLVNAAHTAGVRCIVSIGGAGQDTAFPTLCSSASNINAFASAVTTLIAKYGYDGVDIDWETPNAAPQANATSMMETLYSYVKAMPNAYDGNPRTLSFTTVDYINKIYNMTTLSNYTDWCFYMGYDWYDCPNLYNGPLNLIKSGIAAITNGSTWSYPISKMILGCPLYTNDYTPSCDASEYDVVSILHLGTAGAYNSSYAEQAYTAPDGDTVYVDTTQSYCDKTNWAIGSGLKGIGMWDMGQGLPYTDSLVAPIWSVIGGTSSCLTVVGATPTKTKTPVPPTNTPTKTNTLTPTKTNTPVPPTNTFTSSPTKTNTPVPPTNTFTNTWTATKTNTLTNTPVPPTNTFTRTPTNTAVPPTSTPTKTNTPVPPTTTFTNTSTNTWTATKTNSLTNTPVPPTNTFTNTLTKTNTPVPPTNTPTVTATKTATATFTNTSTNTWTATKTNSPVPPTSTSTNTSVPPTNTPTNTPLGPTNTFTNTATRTNSPTNTPVPPTNTFTSTPTKTNSPVPPTSTSTNTSVPPTNTPTNTPIGPTNTSTNTWTSTHTPVPPTNTATPTNTSAPPTNTRTNTPMPPTNSFTNTPVPPSLTPTATSTSSFTPTSTFSQTATLSQTPTRTPTPSFTFTRSFTATATSTPSSTATSTVTFTRTATASFTPSLHETPVVYPNPVSGPGPVHVRLPLSSASNVNIKIYTTAFRMVNSLSFGTVQPGEDVTVPLTNKWGTPLASGLYYLSIEAGGKHWVIKLMILR